MNPLYAETEFGLNILRQLDPNESAVFSPFSIRYALALVYSASEGETRDEISKVLCEGRLSPLAIIVPLSRESI